MPLLDDITFKSHVESLDSYLNDDKIMEVATYVDEGEIGKMQTGLVDPVTTEMGVGLSVEAYAIDGRGPLNELATQLLQKVEITQDDIQSIKSTMSGEGHKHMQDEAERTVQKVKDEYEKEDGGEGKVKELNDAIQAYNDKGGQTEKREGGVAAGAIIKETKGEGDDKKEVPVMVSLNPKSITKFTPAVGTEPALAEGEADEQAPEGVAVNAALKAVSDWYYDYVQTALDLQEDRAGLSTSLNVQPGAAKSEDGNVVTYDNGDGTYTIITTNDDGTVTEQFIDKYGVTTKDIKYDKNGKETGRVEWDISATNYDGTYMYKPTAYNGEGKEITYDGDHKDGFYLCTSYEGIQQVVKHRGDDGAVADFAIPNGYMLEYDHADAGVCVYGRTKDEKSATFFTYDGTNYKVDIENPYDNMDKVGGNTESGRDISPDILVGGDNKGYQQGNAGGHNDTTLYHDYNNDEKWNTEEDVATASNANKHREDNYRTREEERGGSYERDPNGDADSDKADTSTSTEPETKEESGTATGEETKEESGTATDEETKEESGTATGEETKEEPETAEGEAEENKEGDGE